MKTFALFLCLIATTAETLHRLYLKCEGKEYSRWAPRNENRLRIQSRSTERT